MSRDAHIVKYVQKALMDAALEAWKEEVSSGREIFRKGLDPQFSAPSFKYTKPEYVSRFNVTRLGHFIRYVAVLPDGTEEELSFFGIEECFSDSFCNARVKASWDEIPLLEDLSKKAFLIEQAFMTIDEATMDAIKKNHPWLLPFFDATYESWSVTYRAVEAFRNVLSQ